MTDKSLWQRFSDYHDELFMAPWRAGIARQARNEEEILVAAETNQISVEIPSARASATMTVATKMRAGGRKSTVL